MATLKQIAEDLGVSSSAVSYVLNGRAEEKRISEETKEKILEAVERYHYKGCRKVQKSLV